MNHKELQLILSKAKDERRGGAPHDVWVSRNREILMMQVRNTTDTKKEISLLDSIRNFVSVFFPAEQAMAAARAFAVTLLMVGTVFGGGLVSVFACRDSVPGSLAYDLKLTVEKAQVALAPNDAYRVRLHADFADRRLDEAAKLAEGPEAGRRLAADVLESFSEELVDLRDGLLDMKTIDPEGVALAAKLLDRKMVSYQQVLRGVVRALPSDVRPRALAVSDRVESLSLQAMAVLVEQHLAGDVNASKKTVSDRIEDRLNEAEVRLTVSAEKPSSQVAAQAAIAQAKELLKEENYQAAFSKMVEVVEMTKETAVEDEADVDAEVVTEDGAENDEENKDEDVAGPAGSFGDFPEDSAGSGNR